MFKHKNTNNATYANRSAWAAEDEPCHQKLPLDMWAFMRAQGSAKDADAQHVYDECMRKSEIGLMEIITPKVNVVVFTLAPLAEFLPVTTTSAEIDKHLDGRKRASTK